MHARRQGLVWLVVLGFLLVGCDVGHSMEAVNNTDQPVLARLSVTPLNVQDGNYGYVVTIPAHTRLFIADFPFTGDRPYEIEILTTDCAPIADFQDLSQGGQIVIDDGPRAELRHELPTGTVTVQRTNECPGELPPPPPSAGLSPSVSP